MRQTNTAYLNSVWIFYMLLLPVLYAIKHARDKIGLSENFCIDAVAAYFLLSFCLTGAVWALQYRLIYKNFLRNAKQHQVLFAMLPFMCLVGIAIIIFTFYIIDLREIVSDFLLNNNLVRIVKFYAIVPFSLMLVTALALYILALTRRRRRSS